MKRKISFIAEIVKIIINCITIPLYFIKFFCHVAVYPSSDPYSASNYHKVYYYYSIYDKISREGMAYLVWCAIAIIIISITLSVLSMIFKEKKALKIASYIVFGVTIILFFVLLFIAGSIHYYY